MVCELIRRNSNELPHRYWGNRFGPRSIEVEYAYMRIRLRRTSRRFGRFDLEGTVGKSLKCGFSKKRLPAVPNGLRNGKHRSSRCTFSAKLKLQHHLVEGTLENIRDVRTFDILSGPRLIDSKGVGKAFLVQPERVAQIANRLFVGTMEIHCLDLQYSVPTKRITTSIAQNLNDRNIERHLRRTVRAKYRYFAPELILEEQIAAPGSANRSLECLFCSRVR